MKNKLIISVCSIVLFTVFLIIPQSPWTIDNGIKIIAWSTGSNFSDIPISQNLQSFHENIPFVKPFVFFNQEKLITVFSPFYLFLSGCLNIITPKIVLLLPFVSYLLIAFFMFFRIKDKRKLVITLFCCFNPLLFYAFTFWEMTLATLMLLISFLCYEKRRFYFSALFCALAVCLRIELIFFTLYLLVNLDSKFIRNKKKMLNIVLIFGIVLLLNAFYFFKISGSYFSYNISNHKLFDREFVNLFKNLYYILFCFGNNLVLSIGVYLILILTLINNYFLKNIKIKNILYIIFTCLISVIWFEFIFLENNQSHKIIHYNSLILSIPFLYIVFSEKVNQKVLLILSLLLIMTILSPEYIGVHWSSRFLICFIPILIILLLDQITITKPILFLIITTILIQFYSVVLLYQRKIITNDSKEFIMENSRSDILVDNWWSVADVPALYSQCNFFYIRNKLDLKLFFNRNNKTNYTLLINNLSMNSPFKRIFMLKKYRYRLEKNEYKDFPASNLYLINLTKKELLNDM